MESLILSLGGILILIIPFILFSLVISLYCVYLCISNRDIINSYKGTKEEEDVLTQLKSGFILNPRKILGDLKVLKDLIKKGKNDEQE